MKGISNIKWWFVETDNRSYENWLYKLEAEVDGNKIEWKNQKNFFNHFGINISPDFNYTDFCNYIKNINKSVNITNCGFNVS